MHTAIIIWCSSILQTDTVCKLYEKIREKWPKLSERHFKLTSEIKEISPDSSHLQLDDWEIDLHNDSNIFITFSTIGGAILYD